MTSPSGDVFTTMTSTTIEIPLSPGRWAIDPAHSSVGFTIRHLGIAKVRGRFTRFDADVIVGRTLEDTHVTATVELASVDTGNAQRDSDLQAAHLLDVPQRPTMVFRSTAIRGADSSWTLDGELTFGRTTRPVSFAVTFGGTEDTPGGGPRRAGFEARAQLSRADFGIAPTFPSAVLGQDIAVEIDLQLVEP